MIYATGCICGKHMLEGVNEGTCLKCGHGDARVIAEHAYRRNMDATPDPPPPPLLRRYARLSLWDEERCVTAARDWERMHGDLPRSVDWQQPKDPGEDRPGYTTIVKLFGGWHAFLGYIADVPREAIAA